MTNFKEATREALEFLRTKEDVGSLATIDSDGQPYVSPMYFVMGNEFDFFFLTTEDTHKAKNIEKNDKVAFSVGAGPEYISVMIRGQAVLANSDERKHVLPIFKRKLDERGNHDWPIIKLDDMSGQNINLYKVIPKNVTFLNINSTEEPKSNADHLYHLMG